MSGPQSKVQEGGALMKSSRGQALERCLHRVSLGDGTLMGGPGSKVHNGEVLAKSPQDAGLRAGLGTRLCDDILATGYYSNSGVVSLKITPMAANSLVYTIGLIYSDTCSGCVGDNNLICESNLE